MDPCAAGPRWRTRSRCRPGWAPDTRAGRMADRPRLDSRPAQDALRDPDRNRQPNRLALAGIPRGIRRPRSERLTWLAAPAPGKADTAPMGPLLGYSARSAHCAPDWRPA